MPVLLLRLDAGTAVGIKHCQDDGLQTLTRDYPVLRITQLLLPNIPAIGQVQASGFCVHKEEPCLH